MYDTRNIAVTATGLILTAALSVLVANAALAAEPRTATFLDDAFAVTIPESWTLRDDLNEVADLQMGDLRKEAYAIIISEDKQDFNNVSLQGHSDLTRALIAKAVTNYRESEPEYLAGKYPMLRYRLEGTVNDINIVYWHVTVETRTHYHQLLLWSLKSKFADNEADFNSVIRSFKSSTQ